jgi:ABC-type transport system substrate-binding protein
LSGLVSGDADPTSEMNVWALGGATHLWNLSGRPLGDWETEMDQLMQQQMVTLDYPKRKRQYDRVQSLVAEYLPVICLVSPNVLVGVKNDVGNFQPAILEPTTLWNADEIFRMAAQAGARQ